MTDVRRNGSTRRATNWLLLDGNRLLIAGGIVAALFLLTLALAAAGVISIGPRSSIPSLFASGATAGLLTLVTVSLSINQLILSRIFGSPSELEARFEGTLDIRDAVEDITGRSRTPNDPARFLTVVANAIAERAAELERAADGIEGEVWDDLAAFGDDVGDYADRINGLTEGEMETTSSLVSVLSGEYSEHITETRYLRKEYADRLPVDAMRRLDEINDLFEVIAVGRQYLKTMAIQQELARLSRLVSYTGIGALAVVVYAGLAYSSSQVGVPPEYRAVVVASGVAAIFTPLAVMTSEIVRIATIAQYTVSVGPFAPPEEQFRTREE